MHINCTKIINVQLNIDFLVLFAKLNYKITNFRAWNGDAQLLPAIGTVTISKKQLEKSLPKEKPSDQTT